MRKLTMTLPADHGAQIVPLVAEPGRTLHRVTSFGLGTGAASTACGTMIVGDAILVFAHSATGHDLSVPSGPAGSANPCAACGLAEA